MLVAMILLILIAMILFIVSSIHLADSYDDSNKWWRKVAIVAIIMFVIGLIGRSIYDRQENQKKQERYCCEEKTDYEYCPYCGKEIR